MNEANTVSYRKTANKFTKEFTKEFKYLSKEKIFRWIVLNFTLFIHSGIKLDLNAGKSIERMFNRLSREATWEKFA